MANGMISNDELNQFRSISMKKKIDSMELYLIGSGIFKYNMQEVGARIFGDENYSFTVSLIHRCYNFSGQNGGKYKNGCKFEQSTGYRVTRKDIEAFVKKYPNGTFHNGVTFEDFLRTRINARNSTAKESAGPRTQSKTTQGNRAASQCDVNPYKFENDSGDQMTTEKLKMYMIGFGSIGVLILIVLFFTGGLFRHWLISLIVLLMTIGAFSSVKQL
ncbi:MAG: hypothetical protein HFG54_02065 [Lachnospiraceae bacterium]|jgi:hypothetical protein|nr:hypothetical protein [Lachnospiraceae bacterium]